MRKRLWTAATILSALALLGTVAGAANSGTDLTSLDLDSVVASVASNATSSVATQTRQQTTEADKQNNENDNDEDSGNSDDNSKGSDDGQPPASAGTGGSSWKSRLPFRSPRVSHGRAARESET